VVAYAVAAGDRLPEVVAGVGTAGWVVTVVALAGRWPSLLPWGLAGVGACYAVFLSLRSATVDSRALFVAAGFFAAAELGFWSVERRAGRSERTVVVRRLVIIVSGALGTAVLGGLLLVLAAGATAGAGLEAIGVLAAVVTLAIVAVLAGRARDSTST
jgi:hypothetical protein